MLPGLKAALNYHPLFVHFPIVLWLAALLFEIFAVWRASDELQRTASRLLYLGTLAAIITVMTGLAAQNSVAPGEAQRAVGIHETLMLTATSLAIVYAASRFSCATISRRICARCCCSAWWSSACCSPSAPTAARNSSTNTAPR